MADAKLTDLEREILRILAKAKGLLSSTELMLHLPDHMRPRGKNAMCITLLGLVEKGRVRREGSSKKYTRYILEVEAETGNPYAYWPFSHVRRKRAWQQDRN